MQRDEMKPVIEAVLFSMGEAVERKRLAQAFECSEEEIKSTVDELMTEYENRGIEIIEIDDGYQMCTKRETYEHLIKVVELPKNYRLTDVQLETLSIIAYKQPITKGEIEKIRGVSSDHAVNRLLEANLVEECGRMSTPGRPMLFATTQEFLRRFGLKNTDELPDINSEKVETFKIEAEEEIGFRDFTEGSGGSE
ncbi:MAG: SMC-Scp complex subunit ScpB [Lachnospiraceae bacterium]|jgi:segregation and condensation protein B